MIINKKILLYFSLFIVLLCCFSTVSASENVTDNIVSVYDDTTVNNIESAIDSGYESIAVEYDKNLESVDDSGNESLAVQEEEPINDVDEFESTLSTENDNEQTLNEYDNSNTEDIVSTTVYVDSKYTGDLEVGSEENPYKTISSAISNSVGHNVTVIIKNGNYTENSQINLPDKYMSFIGESENGVIISSQSNSYLFSANLNEKYLFFNNLSFKNTKNRYALNIAGNGDLNIINCVFDGFYSGDNNNPAFKISTTTSTIINSKIVNIASNQRISGVGYILFNSGSHIIENTLIDGSIGSTNINVGIFNVATTAVLEINNLSVYNTEIAKSMIQNSGKVKIKNSNFIGNTLKSGNGLLYNNAGNLTVESCIISDNTGFTYLIYETGANSIVTINNTVMDNNKYTRSLLNIAGTNNLNYNWWGINDKPNAIVDYWVVMNPSITKNANEIIVTADYTKYTDGNNLYDLEKLLPEFEVTFKSSNLTLNEKVFTKNGIASAKFTSDCDFQVSIGSLTYNIGDIYVDSNFNGTELGTETNPYKTISKAVSEATGSETIHIKNGNYIEDTPITLINSLNFQGESKEGVIISGGSRGLFNNPFFMTKNIALSFSDLTIKDVTCTGNNAPLSIGTYVSGLTINNCIFENCSSPYGSMNIGSSNAVISNCEIKDSKSTSTFSSAIYFNNNGQYTIKNVNINGAKSVETISNGAIVCKNNDTSISIDNLVINDVYNTNSVINSNGAINIYRLTIKNAKLTNYSNSNNAVLMVNKNSTFKAESVTISDINASYIFNFGENVKIERLLATEISNVNSDVILNFGNNTSTTSYMTVIISNVNSSEIFKLEDDVSIISSGTTISNVDSKVIFDIGKNSNLIFNLNYIISNVNCSYITYVGADSGITFEQGIIAYSNINENMFYNSDNSSNILANYNSFVYNNCSELFNDKGSYNFEFNWWGNNDKPNEYMKNWVVMTTSASKKDSVTVYAYFNRYTDGNNVFELEKSIISRIPVNIITSTGNYNGTVFYAGGQASAEFEYGDNEYVNLTSDKTTITLSLLPVTYYVDSNFDGTPLGTEDNPFKDLYSALSVAGNKDIIFIKNGTYSLLNNQYPISTSVSLVGESKENVIISLTNMVRLSGGSTEKSFINLTFKSNNAQTYLYLQNTNANFNNCNFVDFNSDRVLNIMTGGVTIENCNFSDMTLSRNYLIYHVDNNLHDLIIKNSTFNNIKFSNSAQGLFYLSSVNKFEWDNVTISNCYMQSNYGLFNTYVKDIQIKNSKIINNEIINNGNYGMIYFNGGNNFLIESTIIANNRGSANLIVKNTPNGKMNLTNNVILNNSYTNNLIRSNGGGYFDNNWWGTNDRISEYVNQWVILDADISPDIVIGESTNITVSLTKYITADGQKGLLSQSIPIDETELIITYPSGETTTAVLKDSKFTFPYTTTTENNNTFTFKVDDAEINYTVPIKLLKINIGNISIIDGGNISILAPGIKANMTLIIDGVSETVEVKDSYTKTLENLKAGTHSVVVIYQDGTTFDFDSKSFTVDKLPTEINLDDITVDAGTTIPINFVISNEATGSVLFDIKGIEKLFEQLVDGAIRFDLENIAHGIYSMKIAYEGDDKYAPCEKTITLTINGLNSDLKANTSDITVGEKVLIEININENVTGETTVLLGGKVIPVTFTNGKAIVEIPDLGNGTYTATVKFDGDKKFLADEVNVTFNVAKKELPGDINITTNIPEGTTAPEFSINLPEDATGNFTVYVDGTPYTQELVNGSATVKVPEQTPGNHNISTEYSGDDVYPGFKSENTTMNVPKASIPGGDSALNMTTPEGSATPSYSINLPSDATGNLTVTVDGKNTYTQTLVNGSATVTVPKLASGKHDITVTYTGDNKYSGISKNSTVTVPEPVIKLSKNKNIKMLYSAGTKYQVLVTVDGKATAGVKVTFKFNGKTKTVKTNSKGYAIYKIPTVKPKSYKITATYKGKTVKNTVKVQNIISTKNMKVKKSKKVTKVKVTLKKVNGKYLKSKTIKIKFKGKTYKVKTNKKGVAIWKVKKSMIKKLKVGKKYKYTVTYGKDVVNKKLTIKK